MRQMDSITNSVDLSFSKLREIVEERGALSAAVCGAADSDRT